MFWKYFGEKSISLHFILPKSILFQMQYYFAYITVIFHICSFFITGQFLCCNFSSEILFWNFCSASILQKKLKITTTMPCLINFKSCIYDLSELYYIKSIFHPVWSVAMVKAEVNSLNFDKTMKLQ